MNTFEICIMFLSLIHYNSIEGLRIYFPKNTDAIDDIIEQPFNNQIDFERNGLDVEHEEIERGINPSLVSDGNRLALLKNTLSDERENLKENTLEDVNGPSINKRIVFFNHFRGARYPFVWTTPKNINVPVTSGFFPALNFRRYNMLMKQHKQYRYRPQQQLNILSVPSKRKSAITPPSRDWCRLIGYRVCPRATKF